MRWADRLDQWIRFLMYVLIFWMPYSQAVIETCVILGLILWIVKRVVVFFTADKDNFSVRASRFSLIRMFAPPPGRLTGPIFLFLGFCLVSSLMSEYRSVALRGLFTKTSEWFVIYFLVYECFKERKHLVTAIIVLMVSCGGLAIDSFQQYYITHRDIFMGRTIVPGARATGSFEAPSGLGAVYTIALPLLIGLLLDKSRKRHDRFFLIGIAAMFIWSLVLSLSRGAMLGVFMSGFLAVFVWLYHLKHHKIKAYLILYLAALLIILTSKISLGEYKQFGFLNRGTSDFRIIIWDDTFKMIKDRPFQGHGLNTYMSVFQEKYRRKALGKYLYYTTYSMNSPTFAHNCFLQIWAEAGLFSLAAFSWILFKLFEDSIRQIRKFFAEKDRFLFFSLGLLSGLFAFLTQSFFDTNFYSLQLSSYFWFMAGIQMAINRLHDNEGIVQYAKV